MPEPPAMRPSRAKGVLASPIFEKVSGLPGLASSGLKTYSPSGPLNLSVSPSLSDSMWRVSLPPSGKRGGSGK